ncbi:uncharacterized protein DUF421 [Pontibacter ummariensis]|uniref:YetF C-terminal domain-containing protein n=1 Tax=Pontibacter ummariensis TaxID=1610492 RepID=A0A239BBE4_9BACT|nr:YetF domain-containing protein [Pontibacter ummariensis]PRY16415.1 uncharacterized protein DUF421 [Pontibacter ummariensis]SNS04768.1 Protein of unknown function [Pontibacter ummariensis]
MQEYIDTFLGSGEDINWWQMALRAIIVFFAALFIVRTGSPRIFGKNTIFDIVLGIIYGSVLSRAITGNAPFVPTLVAALTLVLLHKGLAAISYHSSFGIGNMIKGRPMVLVKDGEMQKKAMRSSSVTEEDLREALRNSGCSPDLDLIEVAYLERNGDISIVTKSDK